MTQHIQWDGKVSQTGIDILSQGGKMIVSPTKVGYIIMTTDKAGLERKFNAKQRNRNKPGVVLCGSLEQLDELAEMTPKIRQFYQMHWDQDVLLGCILPWKKGMREKYLKGDGREELMTDRRGTSCFVIKFGRPSEQIAQYFWEKDRTMVYASSANPSGKGNRGKVAGIGERIESQADLVIEADEYVAAIQPDKTVRTRYEQGVMVSMVDEKGQLIKNQADHEQPANCPVVIRQGLDIDKIMMNLARMFNYWIYDHGAYY